MIIHHKKNSAFELAIPMVDSATPETFKTGLTVADAAYYEDGAGAWTALAIVDTFAEIGTTGMYQISLSAAEMNHDWVIIKCTATGAADTFVTLRMFARDTDDASTVAAIYAALRADHRVAGSMGEAIYRLHADAANKKIANKFNGETKVFEDDGVTLLATQRIQPGASDDEVELVNV